MAGCASGQVSDLTGGGGTGTTSSSASTGTGTGTGGAPASCSTVQCDPNATCAEGPGGPACTCKDGFTGNGTTCADVDECAKGTAGCDANATCQNTPGAYTCSCNEGYTGDGKSCADVDECADGTAKCDPGAACKNLDGGYSCTCATGYVMDGASCVDLDECTQGTAGCDANATCANTPGSFTCTCKTGYEGDGKTCADIDECQTGTANCDPNATCDNAPGTFKCACKQGYAGNGLTCTPVGLGTPGEVSINAGATTTASTAVTLYLQEPGNLLQNPGAETGDLTGWQVLLSGGNGWTAAVGDPALRLFGTLNFITSYGMGSRSQLVDLTTVGLTQAELDAAPPLTVREWYHGGGYNTGDKYYLKVELRDGSNNVLASYGLGTQASPVTTNATWQVATKTLSAYGAGLRYVYFEDGGNDAEFWNGYYGATMDGASVVVGTYQVRFSNDNVNWSAYQAFAPTLPWTLDAASGMKTVYVQFQDGNNQTWPPVSATIMLQ
ncbi:Microneme protein 4 [Minicystis rosea]|nr:Microneme protein 4 [Minicystis rosea]